MYSIADYGWNEAWESLFEPYRIKNYIPARISGEFKNSYNVITENAETHAILSDLLWKAAKNRSMLPAIGDWVALSQKNATDPLKIMAILPRKSCFSRKAKNTFGRRFEKAGSSEEQIISANVDTVFLMLALDADFKLRKIERYLSIIWESGANAIIILNKADICGDYEDKVEAVKALYPKIPVYAISAIDNWGLDLLGSHLKPGLTISVIGSSGVGKSTMINALLGEQVLEVGEIREADCRGRHTTARRDMVLLPGAGVLIDNPGLRDIKIFGSEESLDKTFEDIVALEKHCRFSDCKHDTEPGCAIKAAIEAGSIDAERLESFKKLQKELTFVNMRREQRRKMEDIQIYKAHKSADMDLKSFRKR